MSSLDVPTEVMACSTPPSLRHICSILAEALLAETLASPTMNNLFMPSSAAGQARNVSTGCYGLAPSQIKGHTPFPTSGSVKHPFVVVGNQTTSPCSRLHKDRVVNTHLPAGVSHGGSEGGSLLALTPPRSPSRYFLIHY